MIFTEGKTYQFDISGRLLSIVGHMDSKTWGPCLVGEETDGSLVPVGTDEVAASNWREITSVPLNQKRNPMLRFYWQVLKDRVWEWWHFTNNGLCQCRQRHSQYFDGRCARCELPVE